MLKCILSLAYIWRNMELTFIFWFKVDCCFPILCLTMALCLIFKWWLRSSAVFNRTNIIHMPTSVSRRLYLMYIGQELSVFLCNAARPVIYEYWHFTQMHDRIMLLRVKDLIYKTSFTPSLFIEVSATSKEGECPCICARDIDLAFVFTMCFHDQQAGRPNTVQNITCNYAGRYVVIYNKPVQAKGGYPWTLWGWSVW